MKEYPNPFKDKHLRGLDPLILSFLKDPRILRIINVVLDEATKQVVITKTEAGEVVAVTRQTDDHEILEVLWEKENAVDQV